MSFKSIANTKLAVGIAAAVVQLPGVLVYDKSGNAGSNGIQAASDVRLQTDPADTVDVYFKFGSDSSVQATVNDTVLRPNAVETFRFEADKPYLSAITASGAATLSINVGRETL